MNLIKRRRNNFKTPEDTFSAAYYQTHNVARLRHLDSLGIDFNNKRVLEIGAGIGDHTYYLLIKGAKVTSTDARPELVERLKSRFGNDCFTLDAEKDIEMLKNLPHFDIIYCYGLLYHLGKPADFLAALKGKCDILLLETCVSSDHRETGPYVVDENPADPTQASSGKGCRPSRNWIVNQLNQIFQYVYFPITQPFHPQFPLDWNKEIEDRDELIRSIFIGSNHELTNANLTNQLPVKYKSIDGI